MRIVHITNYFMPEMGYQEHYLARFQASAGHDVHVITSNRAYPPQIDYGVFSSIYPSRRLAVGVERRDGYVVHRLQARLERNTQLFLSGLIRELRALAPDLVVAHGFSRYETLRLAAYKRLFRSSFRLVVDDHTFLTAYHPALYRRVYHGVVRNAYRVLAPAFDRVVPVTDETADFVATRFGVERTAMTVLPLGVDVELFTFDAEARSRVRAELGIAESAVVIVYAGKATEEKGLHLLYDACKSVLLSDPTCRLLVVGSGIDSPYASELRRLADSASVGDQIIWHEHVAHQALPGFFSAADIAVWPFQETMASLAASACGRPIVLHDSKVAHEWTGAGNGFTYGSPAELEQVIARLASDPQLRAEMGTLGARFMREKFDWRSIADAFTELGVAA